MITQRSVSNNITSAEEIYVYTLAYPNGCVFYVGKGIGMRIHSHENDAKGRRNFNSGKEEVIRQIWATGGQIVKTKLAYFKTHEQALLYEAALIFFMDRLTNLNTVGESFPEILRKEEEHQRRLVELQAKRDCLAAQANTGLKRIRLELGISQEGIARRTRSVSMGTIKNAENGKRVTYDSATQILEAINSILTEKDMPPITFDNLGLTQY